MPSHEPAVAWAFPRKEPAQVLANTAQVANADAAVLDRSGHRGHVGEVLSRIQHRTAASGWHIERRRPARRSKSGRAASKEKAATGSGTTRNAMSLPPVKLPVAAFAV